MALPRIGMPDNLVIFSQGGTRAALNVALYPEFRHVQGAPEFSETKGDRAAAQREAFAALLIARQTAPFGDQPRIYLGEDSQRFLYGRAKRENEMDCDVVGHVMHSSSYSYLLGEGKGADLTKAFDQMSCAASLLRPRGVIGGGYIVTNNLRWLEWDMAKKQWVGMLNSLHNARLTEDVLDAAQSADPPLMTDKLYLVDSPHDTTQSLPSWCINPRMEYNEIYVQDRSRPGSRTLRKLLLGNGPVRLVYV